MADQAAKVAKVAKGAKFLDKKVPEWADKIKKSKLKMESNQLCILGQLNKISEADGVDALGYAEQLKLSDKQLEDYGFEADEDPKGLAACWKAEIDKRTETAKEAPKEAPKKKATAKKKDV